MTEFLSQTDIGNRALQHLGQPALSATLGFAEPSRNAREISACYGKLRRAELRRNVWRFATRKTALRPLDVNTMLLSPAMWGPGTIYFTGSLASDQNNNIWISRIPNNLGNDPLNTLVWEPYFGPITVSLYDAATTYWAGELVYTTAGDGRNRVYLSLQSSNADNPATATAWSATGIYNKNQVVTHLSVAYMSLIDLNTNNIPSASPASWNIGTTYSIGQKAGGSDGAIYTSIANGNLANNPVLDNGAHWSTAGVLNQWTTVFTGGTGSLKWLQVGGTEFPAGVALAPTNVIYPLGSGPSTQEQTRNVYRLPNGYLRQAPQDPKAGSTSALGAPSNLAYTDWEFEGDYIVTRSTDTLVFRFVADVTDVTHMDDMFCEGLSARIAYEACEAITQSTTKQQACLIAYRQAMSDARTVNGIEVGPTEPPEDDFVSCRA